MDQQTLYTKSKTKISAITFEVHEGGVLLPNWTHGHLSNDLGTSSMVTPGPNAIAIYDIPSALQGTAFTLPIYPQELQRIQPARVEILPGVSMDENLQPVSNVDVWGMSPPSWSLRGNTGWRLRKIGADEFVDGYMFFVALFNFFENFFKENAARMSDPTHSKPLVQMLFYNWSDTFQDAWYVIPRGLPTKIRTSDKPLLYMYEISLQGIRPFISSTKVNDEIANNVGNYDARRVAIQKSLSNSTSDLQAIMGGASGSLLPSSVQQSFNTALTGVQGVMDKISAPITAFKDVATSVSSTLTQLNTFKTQMTNVIIEQPLSELWGAIHAVNNIVCGLKSLASFNIDAFNDLDSEWQDLMSSIMGSGCGTTLRF